MNEDGERDPAHEPSDRPITDSMPPQIEGFGAVAVGVVLGVLVQSLALLVVYILIVAVTESSKAAGAVGLVMIYLANVVGTTLLTRSIYRSGRRIRATAFLMVSIVSILLTGSCSVSIWNYISR